MLCYRPVVGTSQAECCNYYTNNSCVDTCQAPLVADQDTFDCGKLSSFVQPVIDFFDQLS